MGFDMKRVLLVALVVVVLFTGIPVVTGMPLMGCADCDLGTILSSSCILAVLTGLVALTLSLLAGTLAVRRPLFAGLLASSGLYRPPRLV